MMKQELVDVMMSIVEQQDDFEQGMTLFEWLGDDEDEVGMDKLHRLCAALIEDESISRAELVQCVIWVAGPVMTIMCDELTDMF